MTNLGCAKFQRQKKTVEGIKKIEKEGIAWFNDEFSIKGLSKESIYDRQICDFRRIENDKNITK